MNETFGKRLATEAEAKKMLDEALRYKQAEVDRFLQREAFPPKGAIPPETQPSEPNIMQRLIVLEDRVSDNGSTTQNLINDIFERLHKIEKAIGL